MTITIHIHTSTATAAPAIIGMELSLSLETDDFVTPTGILNMNINKIIKRSSLYSSWSKYGRINILNYALPVL